MKTRFTFISWRKLRTDAILLESPQSNLWGGSSMNSPGFVTAGSLVRSAASASLIKAAVAVTQYHVTRKTLSRAVADGRLTDHRKPEHGRSAALMLCENEVAMYWPPREQGQIDASKDIVGHDAKQV